MKNLSHLLLDKIKKNIWFEWYLICFRLIVLLLVLQISQCMRSFSESKYILPETAYFSKIKTLKTYVEHLYEWYTSITQIITQQENTRNPTLNFNLIYLWGHLLSTDLGKTRQKTISALVIHFWTQRLKNLERNHSSTVNKLLNVLVISIIPRI